MSPPNDQDSDGAAPSARLSAAAGGRLAGEPEPDDLTRAPESVRRFVRDLRERQAELALENERLVREQDAVSPQTRYLSLFHPDPVGFLTVGLRSFILEANDHAARLLRVPVRDLTRGRLPEFILPSSHAVYERHRSQLLASGEEQTCEVQLLRRGARPFWAQLELGVTHDPDSGARLCSVGISDIGERRRARESMSRLAALVESSSDAIFSRDMRGRIMSWNRSAELLLGYDATEILGQSFHILVPQDQLHEEARNQNRIRLGETLANIECLRVHKDGFTIPVSITSSPIYGENAQIVGISEIARDIRTEKRVQQDLHEQMRQLDLLASTAQALIVGDEADGGLWSELADRLRKSLRGESCCIYVVAPEGNVLSLAAVASLRPEYPPPVTLPFNDNLSGQVARRKTHLMTIIEEPLGAEGGSLVKLGVRCYAGFPLLAHGTLLGVLAFGAARQRYTEREIHLMQTLCDQIAATLERGRLIGELRAREAALKDADRRKDDFIATLAHELRNPLAPIRNAAVALRYSTLLDPKFRWCRDVIERQVGVMADLLEDLLDVSRLTRRRIELHLERADLARIIAQAVETVRPLIDEMGHQLSVSMPNATISVNGDATRLTQVLGNLLNNAAKYTDRGGQISLGIEVESREAVIRVRDSGIGISAEHLPKVFELFSQVESALTRSRGGIGVGLSLAKALVDLHGGRISAASEGPGKGSEFSVYLPIVDVTNPEVATHETDLPGTDASTGTRARRVLVVDDNVDVARSLESVLQSAGHEVRVANDGEHALHLAEQYRPHAVLLDIGMPDMNGYEICRRLREKPWSENMLIVACTGWGRPTDRALAKEAGFDHHLVKPADPEKLLSLIR